MSDDEGSVDGVTTIAGIAQLSPQQAFEALSDGDAALVDVRTRAEWAFVGLPDLSPVGAQPVLVECKPPPPPPA